METKNILVNATLDARKSFIDKNVKYAIENLNQMIKELETNEWNLDKVAPHPSSRTDNKWSYRQKQAMRSEYYKYFTSVNNSPTIVQLKTDAMEKTTKEAEENAALSFDKYIAKLTGKINNEITDAKLNGNLWNHSILSVTLKNGEIQNWKTQMIINRSAYNKLFNQFPTRLIK